MAGGVEANKRFTMQSWSDLPLDIISLIINCLHYADQIRFRAVCKSWRAAYLVKYADKSPWLMAYNDRSCFLYDHFHERKYTVSNNNACRKIFAGAKALASKHGWVLFSKYKSLFFYSPFTDKTIEVLPKLYGEISVATFSTSPVSPDCVIFTLNEGSKNFCSINICKPRDKRWSRFWFGVNYPSPPVQVEYVEGVLYCSFPASQRLGGFDVTRKKWKTYPYPPKNPHILYSLDFLIESEGELFMAQNDFSKWRVLRCDRSSSEMKWLEVDNLDKGSLFLGHASIMIQEASESFNTAPHFIFQLPESHPPWNREEFTKIWLRPPQWS